MTKAITDAQASAVNGGGYVEIAQDRISVVSREITADEFIALMAIQTEDYALAPGMHAVIRSLDYPEVKRIIAQNKGDIDELELSALVIGTLYPKLTPAHVEQLRKGRAGPLMNMAKRIMIISGMMDDDKALGEDGASSSLPPGTEAPN